MGRTELEVGRSTALTGAPESVPGKGRSMADGLLAGQRLRPRWLFVVGCPSVSFCNLKASTGLDFGLLSRLRMH